MVSIRKNENMKIKKSTILQIQNEPRAKEFQREVGNKKKMMRFSRTLVYAFTITFGYCCSWKRKREKNS